MLPKKARKKKSGTSSAAAALTGHPPLRAPSCAEPQARHKSAGRPRETRRRSEEK
jgi:hypothetical protein